MTCQIVYRKYVINQNNNQNKLRPNNKKGAYSRNTPKTAFWGILGPEISNIILLVVDKTEGNAITSTEIAHFNFNEI